MVTGTDRGSQTGPGDLTEIHRDKSLGRSRQLKIVDQTPGLEGGAM